MKSFDPANQSPRTVNKLILGANVITLSGTTTDGHTARIIINGAVNYTNLSYLTSTTVTADAWCLANYDYYKVRGFLVTAAAGVITVSPAHSWDTTNRIDATITTLTGTLTGTYKGTLTLDGSKARIWEVVLTTPEAIIAAPVGMKDGMTIKIILVSYTTCAVTTTSTVYINGTSITTFDVDAPYIIDATWAAGATSMSGNTLVTAAGTLLGQTLGSLGQARKGEIFYPLKYESEEITDESGNQILIPEQVYIY
jgi:hypothetical protein